MKCRERLLNPHRLKLNFSILPIVEADGEKYRMFSQTIVSIATGSCQCFKDCDCAADKGKRTETIMTWYRNVKFDDTGKCFYSEPHTPIIESLPSAPIL